MEAPSVYVCHCQRADGTGDRESTHSLLSPVDLIQYFWYTPYCWFYSKCPSLKSLQSSLIKILPLYPELCSIKKEVLPSLRLDHGAYDEEGRISYFVEIEHQLLSSFEDSSEDFSTSSLFSQTDPSEGNAFQLISEKLIPSVKREKDGKEAMFRVKLLELRDGGGVLSFQINHALADGCAVFHFVNTWARSSSSSTSPCSFASSCCSSMRVRTLGGLGSSKWNPRLEKRIAREELQPLGWYLLNAEDEVEKKVGIEEKTALDFSIPEVVNFRISRKTIESCKSILFSDPQFGEELRTCTVLSTNDIMCAVLYWTFAKFHVDEQKERRKDYSSSSSSSKPLSLNIVWNFREVCPVQQREGGNIDFQDFGNFTSWAFVSMPREEVLKKTITELALIIRKAVERCCTLAAAQTFVACCAQQYAQKGVGYTPDVSPLIPGAQLGDVLFVTNWTKFTNMWDNDFGTGKPFGFRGGPPSFLGMVRVLPVPIEAPIPKDLDWKRREEEEGGTEWSVPLPEGTKKGLEELGIDLQKLEEVIEFVQKHHQNE